MVRTSTTPRCAGVTSLADYCPLFPKWPPRRLADVCPGLSSTAAALAQGLLCMDPTRRFTASQALAHPFFAAADDAGVALGAGEAAGPAAA
jgi:hypothetical protein